MRPLLLACSLGALLLAGPARAEHQETFSPTIHGPQPWEAGHDERRIGFGTRQGRAALPGKDRLLVVGKRGATQVFVTKRTQVLLNGQKVASDTLHEGDQVRATYDIYGNTLIARRVEILRPKVVPPAPSP